MPLVDLKTDLRSIRFGSPDAPGDRPNGAWSNQPYITTPIGADFLAPTPNRFAIGKGSDFILRGGASAFVDATTDDIRLGKMFTDLKTPNGIQFVAKQELLSMTGVNIFAGYPTSVRALNRARLNDGVYTPLSALLAAGPVGNLIGGHPNKQGLDPTGNSLRYSRPQYTNLVNRDEGSEKRNRLLNLDKKFIKSNKIGPLFSYLGGPNAGADVASVNTIIHFAKDGTRTGINNPLYINNKERFFGKGGATLTGAQLDEQKTFRISGVVQDFRTKVTVNRSIAEASGMLTRAPIYQDKQLETRVNLGDPGSKLRNRSSYTKGSGIVDAINGLYMYKTENVNESSRTNDFVKFRFAVIDPDNPAQKTFVHFRSFFNGSITDNMSAQWDSFKYQGRGEDFFHYGGFSRELGFGFTVVAQSREELSIMYQKLNYLQSTLAPNYSTEGYMRGNIHQVTIGGYLYEVPGVITSLNYTMPQDTTWEIGISDGGGFDTTNEVKELAHRMEVTVSFKPIHNFLPQTIKDVNAAGNIESRFISLANGSGTTNQKHNLYANGIKPRYKIPTKNDLAITELEFENLEFEEEEEFNGEFNFRNPLDDLNSEITRLENRDRG